MSVVQRGWTNSWEALGLPVDKLTKEQSEQLQELVRKYSDVFALSDEELGCTDVVKHVIDTGDHSPIRQQTSGYQWCIGRRFLR